ncbi:hypothetical protein YASMINEVIRUS_942 [Yasminevirus sp. GU-2018]|uniref:Uncharacterized protein n=1 Tax=Yasminevirus sp. GU-2018 TaxID=2420051 RepID=A0A5K0U8K8_9VIRU|nr:hypothetical protein YASMINEVIRUS_942 [Yasminevirus sp. GU-2018]
MSYSTPSEKYRKYRDLLQDDPHNEVYSRKLTKYGNMLKKSQKGGNLLDQILTNTPQVNDVPATNEPVSNADASGSGSKAKTENLIRKINDMVAYAQENGMSGGSKKRSTHGSGSGSRVKGYRQMVGGGKYELPKQIQTIKDKLAKPMGEEAIIQGVTTLKDTAQKSSAEAEELKQTVASLNAQLEALRSSSESAKEQIGTKEQSLKELTEAYEALRKAIGVPDGLTYVKDVEEAKAILKKSADEIERLKQEIEALKAKAQTDEANIRDLSQKLVTAEQDLRELEGVHNDTIKGYDEIVAEYDRRYTDLMSQIGALTE